MYTSLVAHICICTHIGAMVTWIYTGRQQDWRALLFLLGRYAVAILPRLETAMFTVERRSTGHLSLTLPVRFVAHLEPLSHTKHLRKQSLSTNESIAQTKPPLLQAIHPKFALTLVTTDCSHIKQSAKSMDQTKQPIEPEHKPEQQLDRSPVRTLYIPTISISVDTDANQRMASPTASS